MSSFTNIFSGSLLAPSQLFYNNIILSSNLTLSFSTDFGSNPNPTILASINDVSPTTGGLVLTLPDARLTSVGFSFSINNKTGIPFTLNANNGSLVTSIAGPSFNTLYLTNNQTQAGSWTLVPFSGTSAVTSVAVNTSGTSGNIITSGSPITSAGTISLTLGDDLAGLTSLGNNVGIAVRTASNGTWATTSLLGTANQIAIANANGVAGQPTISLVQALSNLTSISLNAGGNLDIGVNPNKISANNANGGITLQSLGTGNILLQTISGLVEVNANLEVLSSQSLILQDLPPSNTISLRAAGVVSSYTIIPPTGPGLTNQIMEIGSVVGSTMNMIWTSPGSGTVTAITAGANMVLTPNPIVTTGTVALSSTPSGLITISVGNIITNPAQNSASAGLSLGNPYQNALGYDVILTVYLEVLTNTSGDILCGVANNNAPAQQTILTGSSTVGYFPITVYLPSSHWVLISLSGTITASIRGQQVTPV